MKQSKSIILLFFLFQIQSCILINKNIKTDIKNIDSLIGLYQSTNKRTYNSSDPTEMTITIKKDSSCYIAFSPNCTCPTIGHFGKWKVKGKSVFLENYPMREPVLVDSKKTNDKFITIQTIGDAPICWVFSNGNFVDFFNNSGFFEIPKSETDSIIVTDNIYRYVIYNKELKENNFTIKFFEIKSTMEFNYKLKITNEYSLKGEINNFDYIFFKKE